MRFGKIRPQGTLSYDTWQKIFEHNVTDADSYTKLLLHMDGSDASTTFADVTGKTVTPNGDAQLDTAQKKFGISSALFDGTGDYLTLADSDDWYIGTGDFTVDFWVRFHNLAATEWLVGQTNTSPSDEHEFYIIKNQHVSGDNLEFGYNSTPNGGYVVMQNSWEVVADTWYHLAFVISGNEGFIFINGVSQLCYKSSFATTDENFTGSLFIGKNPKADNLYFNGWIDEMRISKGIARWTANFTPPTLPYTSKITSLLIDGLDGNTDEEYRLICRFISGSASSINLRINNDSGNNYSKQRVYGENATVGATLDTGDSSMQYIGYIDGADKMVYCDLLLYTKSGYIRTAMSKHSFSISTTTVTSIWKNGYVWNNTTDNITSLIIISTVENGINSGSVIELYKKLQK